ncbi:sensor histidine kinase [Actinoplanes sp. CA-142083]|uniref:sensor histidine kinase n=1 Tax=Actinoplanes sp. CA-142083 TaxID=3239903 RepID=UPI003D9182CF
MTTAAPSVFLRGLSRGQLLACDAVLAVGAAVLGWLAAAEVPLASSRVSWHEPAWVSALIGLLLGVPVAVRRLRPELAAWSAIALCAFASLTGAIPDYAGIAPSVVLGLVLYTVGTDVRRGRSVLIVLVGIAVLGVAFALATRELYEVGLVLWALGICWTLGRAIRERRAYAAQSAGQVTELALRAERLRIARDLHDIVSHNMSVIAVRATIADHIADARPEELRESLRLIATTSRETLAELRGALGALRAEAVVAPTPGLTELDELVAAARSAGLAVDLEVRGDRVIPESVGVAVFRVVQEAVTNVLKHARATTCWIEVDLAPGEVRIEVTDDGAAGPANGIGRSGLSAVDDGGEAAGQGLIGMRERVAMFGGELVAGPRPEGGWRVATTLRYSA